MFDLGIFSCTENDLAVTVVAADIAGTVDQLRIFGLQRILYEGFAGLCRVVVIAKGQRTATDTDFALPVTLHKLVFLI